MSETGHIPNINKFVILIQSCLGYEVRFNPSNNNIKTPAMQSALALAQGSIQTINDQAIPRANIINARQLLYQQLPLYATRILSALSASENINAVTIEDAATHVRKIRGERKSKKLLNPSPTDPKQISASQRSYANQVEFFDKLISFVLTQPTYLPNEIELQEVALRDFETQLRNANKDAIEANTPWLNALISRDEILYAKETGLVDRALAVKKYVKSVKAITPAEYQQISVLKFTRPRVKF